MGDKQILGWILLTLTSLFLVTGCGDLEPEMQDTRTITLQMDFAQRSSSRTSNVTAADLSAYNTHLIMAQPAWEYLKDSYMYPTSLAEGLLDPVSGKITLEIPLNTEMKIFAFLFKENYSHNDLFSTTREVGYYGESPGFSITTLTDSISLNIRLTEVSGTNTGTTDTVAPVLTEAYPVTNPTSNSTPDYTFKSTEAGTISYGGLCSSTTLIAYSGDNNIHFNYLTDGYYEFCTITVKDYDGNISNTLAVTPFTVDTSSSNTDTTAPLLTEVTAVLDTTYGNPLYYTFSSTEAGNITYGGSCSSTTTTTAIIGNNYITFNTLVVGTYTGCTITVRDSAGNESTPLPVSTFSVL